MTRAALDGGLARYLREIDKFPLLAAEEEAFLARRWREHGDLEAAHRLITSHLRLVAKIAIQYRGYGRPLCELVSEGSIGMLTAVKRFDPDRGFRLATYAIWWIRAAIMEYVVRSCSLVKMGTTAAQRRLFFNLRRLKGRLAAIDGEPPPETVKTIATELGVSEADVVSMDQRLAAPDYSLNTPMGRADGEGADEWIALLVDDAPSQETVVAELAELRQRRHLVLGALKQLDPRERDIILERFSERPTTLGQLSERYAVSRERIRQIEGRALAKMRKRVRMTIASAPG